MEKLIRPYDKECMKMAMLKHEETFKEQVYELHRLYRIQKLLMKTIGSGGADNGVNPLNLRGQIHRADLESLRGVDPERPVGESNTGSDGKTIEESQIELTLGPPSYYNTSTSKSRKGGETQLTNNSSSFSSSSTGSSDNIFSGKTGKFGIVNKDQQEQLMKSERLKLNHPPWVFQALSLNSS